MINILQRFGFGKASEEKSEVAERSLLTLSRVNFNYSIGAQSFGSLNYVFDITLPISRDKRVEASKASVQYVTNLLDGLYSEEKWFLRKGNGNVSTDERKIQVDYCSKTGFSFVTPASLHFTANLEGSAIKRAYFFVFLHNHEQELLLNTHDALISLQGIELAKEALTGIAQINNIRNGNGPTIENLLLN